MGQTDSLHVSIDPPGSAGPLWMECALRQHGAADAKEHRAQTADDHQAYYPSLPVHVSHFEVEVPSVPANPME